MAIWRNTENPDPYHFRCGYCGREVSSREGYYTEMGYGKAKGAPVIFICPGCNKPSYFCDPDYSSQTPAPLLGNDVEAVPDSIAVSYKEARQCTKVEAYTACVLVCRKLLMHLAVQEGAEKGKSFLFYVEYLTQNGYIPPNGKIWVDHIRKKGNEANHEIVLMTRDDAFELLSFIEMLLKFIYEFPARIGVKDSSKE